MFILFLTGSIFCFAAMGYVNGCIKGNAINKLNIRYDEGLYLLVLFFLSGVVLAGVAIASI